MVMVHIDWYSLAFSRFLVHGRIGCEGTVLLTNLCCKGYDTELHMYTYILYCMIRNRRPVKKISSFNFWFVLKNCYAHQARIFMWNFITYCKGSVGYSQQYGVSSCDLLGNSSYGILYPHFLFPLPLLFRITPTSPHARQNAELQAFWPPKVGAARGQTQGKARPTSHHQRWFQSKLG